VGDWDPKVYCLDPSAEHRVEEFFPSVVLVRTGEGYFSHCSRKDRGASM
jgi:hypothetical protein